MKSRIKQHTFSDEQLLVNTSKPSLGCDLSMYMPREFYKGTDDEIEFFIDKDDAIALCEHFELLPKERHDQQVDSGDSYVTQEEAHNLLKGMGSGTRLIKDDIDKARFELEKTVKFVGEQTYTPEVGEECEFQSFIGNDWIKGVLLASTESYAILKSDKREHSLNKENVNFRPLKTERDIAIDQFIEINRKLGVGATERQMFEALYDAGLRIVK